MPICGNLLLRLSSGRWIFSTNSNNLNWIRVRVNRLFLKQVTPSVGQAIQGGVAGRICIFEIRETSTQKPLNPLLWQFEIADETDPELRGIWLLPMGNGSINGRQRPVKLEREGVVVAVGRIPGGNRCIGPIGRRAE